MNDKDEAVKVVVVAALALCAAVVEAKTIRFGSGMRRLERPMVVSTADSGTRFVGAADGSTVISGGVEVKGWTDRGGGVWSAPVPRDVWGNPIYFELLFVNGRRAQRARQPNRGFFHLKRANHLSLTLEKPEADLFAAVPAGDLPYVHLVGHCKWDVVRRPIGSFDAATGTVTIPGAELTRWREPVTNEQYFVENLRSAFDESGEWFYDVAASEILYRPLADETLGTATFVAPRPGLQTLLLIDGAEDVVFENVTFAHSAPTASQGPSLYEPHQAAEAAPSAVLVNRSRRISFRNCRFRGTGGYGLEFRNDCVSNSVLSCVFTDLGAGGVRIGPVDARTLPGGNNVTNAISANAVVRPPAAVSFNLVSNCVFRGGGRFHESGIGVFVGHASDCRIVKNTIDDFFYTGISVGWVWGYSGSDAQRNLIGWNRISRIGQRALSDMGGIYTLATSFGTRIVGNVITDIDAYSYGGWGIYPDEGSEGIVIEGNYVRDTNSMSFHQHYGRNNVVRNNDFGRSRQGPVAVTRSEPHVSVIFENNYYDDRLLSGDEPSVTNYVARTVNVVWRNGGARVPVDVSAAGANLKGK